MAFPGNRKRRRLIPILASVITGEMDFDGIFSITEIKFKDADKTLDGEFAISNGGGDLVATSDEAGTNRLYIQVVRCEINANPALSKIEIWVRVPNVSDTVDTPVYFWWGDPEEVQPAVDAPYGRNGVWNGPSGTGTPITTWGVWNFDEDPSNPKPQFTDSSGNGHHMATPNGYEGTRVNVGSFRGHRSVANGVASAAARFSFSSGGPWSLFGLNTIPSSTGYTGYFGILNLAVIRSVASVPIQLFYWVGTITGQVTLAVPGSPTLVFSAAAHSTDSDTLRLYGNSSNYSGSNEAIATDSATNETVLTNSASIPIGMLGVLTCAPNAYWFRALSENMYLQNTWDDSFDSTPIAITAEIYFADLNAGTEVRIYEQPHGQSWSADLAGITPEDLNDTYIAFQIQGESAASDHYVWFNYNSTGTDPDPGGTGHAVAVATTDTIAQVAATLQGVLDGITDLSATVSGTLVTVLNDRNGELTEPADGGTTADIVLIQVGGTATDEIDGIESSTGTSWTASYQILRPRKALIAIASPSIEITQYYVILTTGGLTVPAGALSRKDYVNE